MEKKYEILVIDDEFGMRDGVERVLKPYGHNIHTADCGKAAGELIQARSFDLALIDLKLPDADGLDIMDSILKKDPLTVCIIITAYANLDTAIDATRRGAFDYLAKPFTADQLLTVLDKALDRRDLLVEARKLREERDRSLLELSREQSRFRTIISSMTDGVIVTNMDGEVVLYNRTGRLFLKEEMDINPGTPLKTCSACADFCSIVEESTTGDEDIHITGREMEIAGKTWLANCAVLKDKDGGFLGTVTVFRDISRMKEMEKVKSRFISLVAHELRAPVSAIKGYLDIILKKSAGEDPATYQKMMERSRERATGLIDLINDLLDMSRIDSRKIDRQIKPLNAVETVSENLEFFRQEMEKRGITFDFNATEKDMVIRADRNEFNRIITNLLSNAIKYNREQGKITVTLTRKDDMVLIAIKDTGIGMNEEEQTHLFEDFYRSTNPLTRQQTGTGLGLAITRRMVEANYGRITVESVPGEGSTFTLWMPCTAGLID